MADGGIGWQDLLNAATGLATAIFAGVGVWLVWLQQRDKITAEWDFQYHHPTAPSGGPMRIWVRCNVRNGTGATLKVWKLDVRGPVVAVEENGPRVKDKSWAAGTLPLHCEPAPGAAASFSAMVTPDWAALHAGQQHWLQDVRKRVARWLWKAWSIRVHHGASLHFQITIDSKSNRRFRRVIAQTMQIMPEMAAKNAAPKASQ